MDVKKFIVPGIIILLAAGIITGVIVKDKMSKNFDCPYISTVESDIKEMGFDVGRLDFKGLEKLGVDSDFERIWAKYNDKEKNAERMISISCSKYDNAEDAQKAFDNAFSSAYFTKEKSKKKGDVKIYNNPEKHKEYILYNVTLESEGMLDNYALSTTNEDDMFNPKSKFLYGGIYLDGNRIVYYTTSDGANIGKIKAKLEEHKLPTP